MISIITCSIKPHEAESLRKNIENTIGVPFEFIAYDNRGTGKGLSDLLLTWSGAVLPRRDSAPFLQGKGRQQPR